MRTPAPGLCICWSFFLKFYYFQISGLFSHFQVSAQFLPYNYGQPQPSCWKRVPGTSCFLYLIYFSSVVAINISFIIYLSSHLFNAHIPATRMQSFIHKGRVLFSLLLCPWYQVWHTHRRFSMYEWWTVNMWVCKCGFLARMPSIKLGIADKLAEASYTEALGPFKGKGMGLKSSLCVRMCQSIM